MYLRALAACGPDEEVVTFLVFFIVGDPHCVQVHTGGEELSGDLKLAIERHGLALIGKMK